MRYFQSLRTKRVFRIALILLALVGVVYQLLFSPWGNRLLVPAVEKALSSAFSTPVKVHEFSLTHNRFDLLFQDTLGNTLSTQGGFSLLTLRMYAHYRVECFKKGGINAIGSPLSAEGSLSGGIAAFDIHGSAKMLEGDVLYRVQLHRFNLASVNARFNALSYEKLLALLDYPSSTDTAIWGKVDLKGFDRRDVTGEIRLVGKTGSLTPTPILAEDNDTTDLRSLLADRYGRIKPFDVNVSIDLSMEHAGILEQFVGTHLSGPADLQAEICGDEKLLTLNARTSVARSDTSLRVLIPDLEPQKVSFSVAHADAGGLFSLFTLPAPLKGSADARGELTRDGGTVEIRLSRASTVPNVLKTRYAITQPPLYFDAALTVDLSPDGARYRGSMSSDLKRLEFADSAPRHEMLRELLKTFR